MKLFGSNGIFEQALNEIKIHGMSEKTRAMILKYKIRAKINQINLIKKEVQNR